MHTTTLTIPLESGSDAEVEINFYAPWEWEDVTETLDGHVLTPFEKNLVEDSWGKE